MNMVEDEYHFLLVLISAIYKTQVCPYISTAIDFEQLLSIFRYAGFYKSGIWKFVKFWFSIPNTCVFPIEVFLL